MFENKLNSIKFKGSFSNEDDPSRFVVATAIKTFLNDFLTVLPPAGKVAMVTSPSTRVSPIYSARARVPSLGYGVVTTLAKQATAGEHMKVPQRRPLGPAPFPAASGGSIVGGRKQTSLRALPVRQLFCSSVSGLRASTARCTHSPAGVPEASTHAHLKNTGSFIYVLRTDCCCAQTPMALVLFCRPFLMEINWR